MEIITQEEAFKYLEEKGFKIRISPCGLYYNISKKEKEKDRYIRIYFNQIVKQINRLINEGFIE